MKHSEERFGRHHTQPEAFGGLLFVEDARPLHGHVLRRALVRKQNCLLRGADEQEHSAGLLDACEVEEVGRLPELDRVDVLLGGEDDGDAVCNLVEDARSPRGELGLVELALLRGGNARKCQTEKEEEDRAESRPA
jgi:hypothetical protein